MQDQVGLHPEKLRISPWPLFGGLVLSFLVLQVAEIPEIQRLTLVIDSFYLAGIVAWSIGRRKPIVGRWLALAILIGLILASNAVQPTPGLLTLLAVPCALATSLLGLTAAAGTALVSSFLLVALAGATKGTWTGSLLIPLLTIWGVFGAVCATYLPVHAEAEHMWEYYQKAQVMLRDARDRSQALNKAIEDLAFANQQLALLHEKVNSLRLVAEQAERAKAAFLAKVSHEFRTPLNMIIGLSSLLTETPQVYGQQLPPKLREHLEIVHRNCLHLSSMIDDVLDLSQVQAGKMALHREPVELGQVIEWAASVVRPLVEKKQLTLEVEVDKSLPAVECDRTRISQVIINLLSNAARFTDTGSIRVQANQEDGHVLISVADTGPGISEQDARVIFEPFSQGSSRRHNRGGSGLGLTISKQFVELHGGRMWLESRLGVGSTFFVRLPITRPPEPLASSTRWIAEGWMPQSPSLHLPPVRLSQRLIVCDETGELARLLARYEELTVISTQNLAEAIREVQARPAAAVLVNAATPGELWPLLDRTSRDVPDTPIIGCSLNVQAAKVARSGTTARLTKPVTRARLAAAIAAIGRPVRRVLVVDDGADDREVLTSLLRSVQSDLEIATASGGEEALESLRRFAPDAMLLDILMPDMDGWQVLERMRRDAHVKDVPVIIVSAQDLTEQPLRSRLVLATMGDGLPANALLNCLQQLPALLMI